MAPFVYLSLVLLAGGCGTVKPPVSPDVAVGAQYKEAPAPAERRSAVPAMSRSWWNVFEDERLDALIRAACQANLGLEAVKARVRAVGAVVDMAAAEARPSLDFDVGPVRQRTPQQPALTTWYARVNAALDLDVSGRIRYTVGAAQSEANAEAAAYRAALLTLQADVALVYFNLRMLDAERAIMEQTLRLRGATLQLTRTRFSKGDVAEFDVARAEVELHGAEGEAAALARQRFLLEHALALLSGVMPASFSLASAPMPARLPLIPAGIPSDLLWRRADLEQARQDLAAAGARIGVANASYFPRLSLSASAGSEAATLERLADRSAASWLVGPVAGGLLSLPLFDGGLRAAGVKRAVAEYEQREQLYRQRVLEAVTKVEDSLSTLRTLTDEAQAQARTLAAARRAMDLADARYRNGAASVLDLIDAQRTAYGAQRAETRVAGARLMATVALIHAIGGGWD
jgi:multidrug efflux system outer membrane protein